MRVYRLFGGGARQFGLSWTTSDPRQMADWRDALGLPNSNSAEWLAIGELTDLSDVRERAALPLDGNDGGGAQILVASPSNKIVIVEIVRMETRDEGQ